MGVTRPPSTEEEEARNEPVYDRNGPYDSRNGNHDGGIQNLGRNGWRIKWISTEEEFFVNRFLLLENLAKTEGGIHYYYFFFFREKIKYGNVKSR